MKHSSVRSGMREVCKPMNCCWTALLMSAFACAALPAHTEPLTTFPGTSDRIASPDGRFVIIEIDRDRPPYHVLMLENVKTGDERPIRSFDRHVDVMWAPNAQRFFLNDWRASDEADCLVLTLHTTKTYSVLRALEHSSATLEKQLRPFGHLYVSCVSWPSGHSVLVSAKGYNTGELNARFVVDLSTGRVAPAD